MSDLRERARQIKAAGAVERRDWNPKANSIHWKLYHYWEQRSTNAPYKENFCHYWRVVMIWAPLMWLTTPLRSTLFWKIAGVITAIAVIGGLIWVAVKWPAEFWAYVALLVGAAYLVLGIIYIYAWLGAPENDWKPMFPGDKEYFDGWPYGAHGLLILLFSPLIVGLAAILLPLGGLIAFLVWLFKDYQIINRLASMHPKKTAWLNPLTGLATVLVGITIYSAIDGNVVARWTLLIAGFAVVALAVIVGGSWLADIQKRNQSVKREENARTQRAKEAKEAQKWREERNVQGKKIAEVFIRARFESEHPDDAGNEAKYNSWLTRYAAYYSNKHSQDVFSGDFWSLYRHLDYVEGKFMARIPNWYELANWEFNELTNRDVKRLLTNPQPTEPKESKVGNFFDKLIEVGSFAWSIVLVRKWRICPIVEMPDAVN